MLSRRSFFGLTASVAAAFTLDPERALWVRGAKTISIAHFTGRNLIPPDVWTREVLLILGRNLDLARSMNVRYGPEFLIDPRFRRRLVPDVSRVAVPPASQT